MNNIGVFSTRKVKLGFVGIYTLRENGENIWSRSTGIARMTRKDALLDAKREWIDLGGPMKTPKCWIVKDWAGNLMDFGEFADFETAWGFIRERFPDEEDWQEYEVIEKEGK